MKTNQSTLQEVARIQRQTREALQRARQQAAETEVVGATTLVIVQENDGRLDKLHEKTGQLNNTLNKTKRLQDRLAKWGLQFGTHRNARYLARNNRKEQKLLKKIEKEEKQKKIIQDEIPLKEKNDAHQNWYVNEEVPKSISDKVPTQEDRERAELFGDKKQGNMKQAKSKDKNPVTETPLSEEDQNFLEQVNADDQALDGELDLLGDQLETLFGVAQRIDEEISNQNKKLNAVADDLDKADKKQKVAGRRLRLFTLNPKERQHERALNKKVLLQS